MAMVGPPTYPAPIQQIFMFDLVKASEGADKVIPEAETAQSLNINGWFRPKKRLG
jgi:hypothetical protein